jgi:Ca-activated chloride channel family protein
MSFIWIEFLWLLLLVPALVYLYLRLQKRRKKYALRYASLSLVKEALGRGPGLRRHVPPTLVLISLAVMIAAVARPAATIMLPSQVGTVILTLDVSGSMRADDIKPSRLEAAKAAARAFVEKQPKNVRIGVVSFSDGASVVQAPTIDRDAVLAAINRLAQQRRTAVGSGILTSMDAIFEEPGKKPAPPPDPLNTTQPLKPENLVAPGSYNSAFVVLLSDGQSNTGPLPLEAAEKAANRGVRVYTVGMGSAQGTVLRIDGYSIRVRLDEETLKRIAQKTDASYFNATSEAELLNIYENLGTRLVFKAEQTELTAWFTAFAAVLMLTAAMLSMLWFNRLL